MSLSRTKLSKPRGRVGCRLHEDRVHEDGGRTQTPWIRELSRAITRAGVPRGVAVASIARLPSSTDDPRVLGIDGRSSSPSRRRQRWEATGGGPESRGGASAQLSGRAAVQAATGTRGDRRPPRVERWRQYIAASPRRCSGGDRDGRRQTDASSRERRQRTAA